MTAGTTTYRQAATAALAALAAWWVPAAQADVASFDAVSGMVNIPSVSVGATTFSGIKLKSRGGYVFELADYSGQAPVAYPGTAVYDVATNMLSLPAVNVGGITYIDVKLQDVGNFVFQLAAATQLPQSVIDEVNAFARKVEEQTTTRLNWSNGAERLALVDTCWASGGRTRANYIADFDANLIAYLQRDGYLVGRKIQNIQVLAVRNKTNPDGSARREVVVQWDTVYTDGTMSKGEVSTLISGSSSGTPLCTTPQTGSALRALGDQQLVLVRARSNNMREQRYALADGTALSPTVRYRREVEFNIVDPMGNATYVVVTGPGPSNTTGGVTRPFSMKLLSPRLMRSAPELLGKSGNFVNWLDDDGFRNCFLTSGAVPVVALVDCVAQGASSGSSWGVGYTSTADAAADQSFAAQGWVAGGVYRFDVYNDDGWKTVNGQASKTPIATYYDALDRLPFTFVEMADRYPVLNLGNASPAQVAANERSATPAPLGAVNWSKPNTQALGAVMGLSQVWHFQQGPKLGNAAVGVFNPAYRTITRAYPGTTATTFTGWPVSDVVTGQNGKTYSEYTLYYQEPGSTNSVRSRILFQ